MVTIYPPFLLKKGVKIQSAKYSSGIEDVIPSFTIHPPTSELAERLLVDPTSLAGENYSGIYDEAGDYVPQYCDNPEDIPRGSVIPSNPSETTSASDPAPLEGNIEVSSSTPPDNNEM